MPARRVRLLPAFLVVCAFVIAGCGGSDESDTTTASSDGNAPTKARFLREGNEICAKWEAERGRGLDRAFAKFTKPGEGPDQQEAEVMVIEVALPPIKKMTARLAALTPPEGEEDEVAQVVETFEDSIARAEANPAMVVKGYGFIRADKAAEEYGLVNCRP